MTRSYPYIVILICIFFAACDDTIHPKLQQADPIYIVDAFINNSPDTQVVRIMYSQPYLEEVLPPGVSGATVTITDKQGDVYLLLENPKAKGSYFLVPDATGFGSVGHSYVLSIHVNDQNFVAESKMGRVPVIDSITFKKNDRNDGNKDFYRGQFWAVDPSGPGDTYWIRTFKNGIALNKPQEINLAYDAAFTKGASFDGFTFIQPIRDGINPSDTDADDKPLSPYKPGDSVRVEILSLTEASFNYLNQVAIQTNRPGGFGELFSTPLANVSTNILNLDPNGKKVQGFFNVGSVSKASKKFIKP